MQETLNLAGLISILISVVLPILVGLVTKASWNPSIKAVLLLLFTAVTALLSQFIAAQHDNTAFSWGTAILAAVVGFVVAVATHFGLLKPTGITQKVQATLVK